MLQRNSLHPDYFKNNDSYIMHHSHRVDIELLSVCFVGLSSPHSYLSTMTNEKQKIIVRSEKQRFFSQPRLNSRQKIQKFLSKSLYAATQSNYSWCELIMRCELGWSGGRAPKSSEFVAHCWKVWTGANRKS